MIVEERIYTLQIGAMAQYMKNYEAHGLEVQKRILGHLVGYYQTEMGPLNQVIHMWGYENFEGHNPTMPPIPDQTGHGLRSKPANYSSRSSVVIPRETGCLSAA